MTITPQDRSTPPASSAPPSDLGFGSVVARESTKRFLNRDGSFNVTRQGLSVWQSMSPYHLLLTMSWLRFLALFVVAYLIINALFGLAYLACGPEALSGIDEPAPGSRFARMFFFSVHTLGTIGYGNVSPMSLAANVLVTLESIVGIVGIALATGLSFARFSRPTAQIIFSRNAVIAPYKGMTGFMFRVANQRSTQIVELRGKVFFTRWKEGAAGREREFLQLRLERESVAFFPLSWTLVHPIDDRSPLSGLSSSDLEASVAEFLVILNGFDETFSQNVHTRSSYKAHEVVFGAKFKSMFLPRTDDDLIRVDIRELDSYEVV